MALLFQSSNLEWYIILYISNYTLKSIAKQHAAPQGFTFIQAKQNVFLPDPFYFCRCFSRLLINQFFISSQHASWSYVKAEAASFGLVWWRRASLCRCYWHFRTNTEIAGCLPVSLFICLPLRDYNSAISPHLVSSIKSVPGFLYYTTLFQPLTGQENIWYVGAERAKEVS